MIRRYLLCMLLLLVPCFGLGGCFLSLSDDPTYCSGNGSLEIEWLFNGEASCPLDAEDTIIKVFDTNGNPLHTNPQGDASDCQNGHITFPGLACGEYSVVLAAVDELDGISWESASVGVVVRGDRVNVVTINLLPAP